jgi:hypothetical protein
VFEEQDRAILAAVRSNLHKRHQCSNCRKKACVNLLNAEISFEFVIPCLASSCFVSAARKAGFTGSFYTLSMLGSTVLIEALVPLAAGLSITQVVPFTWTLSTNIVREFQAFCKLDTIETSFASMMAYSASNLVVTAIKRMRVKRC